MRFFSCASLALVLGAPGSSRDLWGSQGMGRWEQQHGPRPVLAGKDPCRPRNHVLFLMTLYHQRKLLNEMFFPFVLSSLTEGSRARCRLV